MTVADRTGDRLTFELTEHHAIRDARRQLAAWLLELDRTDLIDEAQLVLSELATNALLHGGGWARVTLSTIDGGVRIDVQDRAHTGPVLGWASEGSMTGRGLALVQSVAHDYGVEAAPDGKVVWAEVRPLSDDVVAAARAAAVFTHFEPLAERHLEPRHRVTLGDVPTPLLLDAKAHVDNLVREFTLAAAGARAGSTAPVPTPLATLIEAVVNRFSEARLAIKRQALDAVHAGLGHTTLALDLPASAADAAVDYLDALDEADAYCRAVRLLTLETPPQHRVFREWYVGELVAQLRAAAAGGPVPAPQPFEDRLLEEIDRVAEARRASERAARLVAVTSALAGAATPEQVAQAVLTEGAAALGAAGGGILLAAEEARMNVPGTVGYSPDLVERLRNEPLDAELPAAAALRTGELIWIESPQERDLRFPQLAGLERDTVAMCAVPLIVGAERIGALRFSFIEPRLFGEDERRFVLALAAQCAQALARAELQHERDEISRRLQRSLLPPRMPEVPGLDVAAAYHPFGRGVDVGGDFYDIWENAPDCWALVIGDVSGTGPEAAGISAQVRHTLHGLIMQNDDVEKVLVSLNDALLHTARGSTETGDVMFCTAVLARIDTRDGVAVRLGSGGHPSPLVRRADGTVDEVVLDGSLLGVLDEVSVSIRDIDLNPGDALVLFTDGLLEARDGGDFFGMAYTKQILAEQSGDAASIIGSLEAAVLAHTHGHLSDDVAFLVVRAPRA